MQSAPPAKRGEGRLGWRNVALKAPLPAPPRFAREGELSPPRPRSAIQKMNRPPVQTNSTEGRHAPLISSQKREGSPMKVCVAGASGAFGIKHLDAIKQIDGMKVTPSSAAAPAISRASPRTRHPPLDDRPRREPARSDVDAVILSTPTQMHAEQGIACMQAGKHVLIEIPDGRHARRRRAHGAACRRKPASIAMAGHVRRFNPEPPVGPQARSRPAS